MQDGPVLLQLHSMRLQNLPQRGQGPLREPPMHLNLCLNAKRAENRQQKPQRRPAFAHVKLCICGA